MISASNAAIWRGPGAQRAIPNLCQVSTQTEAAASDALPPQPPTKPHHRRDVCSSVVRLIFKYPCPRHEQTAEDFIYRINYFSRYERQNVGLLYIYG